jgi:dCMP deaminase
MDTMKWDKHFLSLSLKHSEMSKDPNTRVGAIIVGPDKEIVSGGFNGFPRGIADTYDRLHDRDMKLRLVVHAEVNAILAAARLGIKLKGTTLYLSATDDTGAIWGGPPCTRCTVDIIQAGIREVVSYPIKGAPSRWIDDILFAGGLLREAGILYREVCN